MRLTAVRKPDHVFPDGPEILVRFRFYLQIGQRDITDLPLLPDFHSCARINVLLLECKHLHLVAESEAGLCCARREICVVLILLPTYEERKGQARAQPIHPIPCTPFLELRLKGLVAFWGVYPLSPSFKSQRWSSPLLINANSGYGLLRFWPRGLLRLFNLQPVGADLFEDRRGFLLQSLSLCLLITTSDSKSDAPMRRAINFASGEMEMDQNHRSGIGSSSVAFSPKHSLKNLLPSLPL